MEAIDRVCENCVRRKTPYCPNSKLCYGILYLPYFQDRIMLLKENEELKKQIEENKDKINWYENFEINKTIDELRIKHNNQQKEFIKYLENKIKKFENNRERLVVDMFGSYDLNELDLNILKEILQKYKSIIGGNKDD